MLKFNLDCVVRLYFKYPMIGVPPVGKIVDVTEDTVIFMPQQSIELCKDGWSKIDEFVSIDAWEHPIMLERSAIGGWAFTKVSNKEMPPIKVEQKDFNSFLKKNSSKLTNYGENGFCYGKEDIRQDIRKLKQAEGIATAKANGVQFGRTPIDVPENFEEIVNLWKNKKISSKEAIEKSGLSRSTFYRKASKLHLEIE